MFCSVKKVFLKNFSNFIGKRLYWSLFIMTLRRPPNLWKAISNMGSCNICNSFKRTTKLWREIIFVLATKISENTTNILQYYISIEFITSTKFSLKLNICMYGIKFTSHKQYLFGCFFYRNAKKTRTDQSYSTSSFLLSQKKWLTNLQM